MGSEIFFAEFHQDLLVSLVGPDDGLKVEYEVGVIREDVVAEGSEFFEVVGVLFSE